MTFKDLSKKLKASVQTLPNLINVLADAFNEIEGGSSGDINYSTEEHVIGKWIDGTTDLYEKTVTFNNVSIENSINLGVSSVSMIFLEDGLFYSETTYTTVPYVHGVAALNEGGYFQIGDNPVTWNFRFGENAPTTISGFIRFRYTKINS